jgi:hypothetical protein
MKKKSSLFDEDNDVIPENGNQNIQKKIDNQYDSLDREMRMKELFGKASEQTITPLSPQNEVELPLLFADEPRIITSKRNDPVPEKVQGSLFLNYVRNDIHFNNISMAIKMVPLLGSFQTQYTSLKTLIAKEVQDKDLTKAIATSQEILALCEQQSLVLPDIYEYEKGFLFYLQLMKGFSLILLRGQLDSKLKEFVGMITQQRKLLGDNSDVPAWFAFMLARIYHQLHNYRLATHWYEDTYKCLQPELGSSNERNILINLCECLIIVKDYTNAIKYTTKLLEHYQSIKLAGRYGQEDVILCMIQLMGLHWGNKGWQEAERWMKSAKDLAVTTFSSTDYLARKIRVYEDQVYLVNLTNPGPTPPHEEAAERVTYVSNRLKGIPSRFLFSDVLRAWKVKLEPLLSVYPLAEELLTSLQKLISIDEALLWELFEHDIGLQVEFFEELLEKKLLPTLKQHTPVLYAKESLGFSYLLFAWYCRASTRKYFKRVSNPVDVQDRIRKIRQEYEDLYFQIDAKDRSAMIDEKKHQTITKYSEVNEQKTPENKEESHTKEDSYAMPLILSGIIIGAIAIVICRLQ